MCEEAGKVTRFAIDAITNYKRLLQEYSDPDKVLEFLKEPSHFKTLGLQLKETMLKAGFCDDTAPTSAFIYILLNRLVNQDYSYCGESKHNRKTVSRWFSGETKAIKHQQDAVEICFALELNVAKSIDFLIKTGNNVFNIRDAHDAVYLYCLQNHRPYSAAINLIQAYDAYNLDYENQDISCPQNVEKQYGTTQLLENLLLDSNSWKSDDDFLQKFLLPNKAKFIGYTQTSIREYYRIKNEFYFVVISLIVSDEYVNVMNRRDFEGSESGRDIPISLAIKSAIRKYEDSNSVLFPANQLLDDSMLNIADSLSLVRDAIITCDEVTIQKEIGHFFEDIMKKEGIMKYTLPFLQNENGRLRKLRESTLFETVLKDFPTPKTLSAFEEHPANIHKDNNLSIRKAIVLMYFITYTFELTKSEYESNYISPFFGVMGFHDFIDNLNSILQKCQLPTLYPASQFDWLILRSIMQYEFFDPYESGDTLIKFFNDILLLSFPEGESIDCD